MIPYCAICEVCTPTLMVHIDCTWGVDVEKIPGEAAPCVCGTHAGADEMVIHAIFQLERTGYYIQLNTVRV